MIKVLITGAGGFLGNLLYVHLKKNKNIEIFGTMNKSKYKNNVNKKNLKPKFLKNLIKIDLSKLSEVKKIFNKVRPNIVFHFAAMADHNYAEKNKKLCSICNSKITKNIINSMNKKDKMIFLSTDKIYSQNAGRSPEHTNLKPKGYLAKEKLKCEKIIKKKIYKHFILRLPIVHSNGSNKSFSTIDNFLFSLKKNKKLKIYNNVYRSFNKVDQLNKFLETLILNEKYGIYNTGSKLLSYSQRVKMMCGKLKINSKNIMTIKGNIKPLSQNFSVKKIEKNFGIKFS